MDPRGSSRQGAREQTHPRRRRRRRRHGCATDKDLGCSASDRPPGHHRRPGPRQHVHVANMGKSSRPGAQRTGNNPVADWLAEISPHEPNTVSIPNGHASKRHDRGRDENPWSRDVKRKTASWDPRHARPQIHSRSSSPDCVPPKSSHKHCHVTRQSSPGSASRGERGGVGHSATRRPLRTRSASISDETLSSELTTKVDAPPPYSPSPDLASPSLAYVSRRPRHKVRHDKYETKRAKRERSKAHDDLPAEKPKKSRKTGKKNALTSSKNVMNNWKSGAVLHDRITVQQPLKPGLFKNGREATSNLAQDLAFSPMNFLRSSREKTHPKSLSEKRLRELERQQQGVEDECRFFAASREADTAQKSAPHRKDGRSNDATQDISKGQSALTKAYKPRHLSRSSPELSIPECDELGSCDQSRTLLIRQSPQNTDCPGGQESSDVSKVPIYLSWSSSPSRSPPPPRDAIYQSPSPKRVRKNASPAADERAMMETGVFHGTRVRDHCIENSKKRAADTTGGSYRNNRAKYSNVHERSMSTSSSVSTSRGGHGGRHRADRVTDDEACQRTQIRRQDGSPQVSCQRGRGKTRRPHSGPPESMSPEGAREADAPDGKGECSGHGADAISKSKARPDYARAARLDARSKKKHNWQVTTNSETHQCRILPSDNSKGKAADSNGRRSSMSRDGMPPPPLPTPKPLIAQKDTTSQVYPDAGKVRGPESGKETMATACERGGRGLRGAHAKPMVAEEGIIPEHSHNRGIRAGGVAFPLQSVSWIDPASRPVTPSLTYNTQASGVGIRPTCFADIPVYAPEHDGPLTESITSRKAEESIAEFIVRIESEAEVGMPQLGPHDAGLFKDEDMISILTTEGQQIHYETSEMQSSDSLDEEPWDSNILDARESEAYIGNASELYTTGWEDALEGPEERDVSFTWDPSQYRRF